MEDGFDELRDIESLELSIREAARKYSLPYCPEEHQERCVLIIHAFYDGARSSEAEAYWRFRLNE